MNTISEHKLEWAGTPSFQLAVKTYHDVSNALGLVLAPIKLVEREWLKRLDNAGAWWRERYNAMLDAVLDDDPAVCDLCGCHTTHASHRQTRAHD